MDCGERGKGWSVGDVGRRPFRGLMRMENLYSLSYPPRPTRISSCRDIWDLDLGRE